jgi:hypothetical protein
VLTVFGYAAPQSDAEAVELMSSAWGNVSERNMEQVELIDIRGEDELRRTWSRFIHTHHYDISRDFYNSWIGSHPRRTGEAWWAQFFEAKFISKNRIPQPESLGQLQEWFAPLLAAERDAEARQTS